MYKAVIFDMDGVLVDSQPFHFNADIAALAKCGINAPKASVEKYAGMATAERFDKYRKEFSLTQPFEELIKIHAETISEQLENTSLTVIDGITELITMLKNKNFQISVASSSSYDFIYKMLNKLGIRGYFNPVISGEDMKNSKPAPDIFLFVAHKHGCKPSECIVIEDSASGVSAAAAAGIKCIGYKNPSSGNQDISKADIVTGNFFDLITDTSWLE